MPRKASMQVGRYGVCGSGLVAHRLLPLSLTFVDRAVTGGEAARFLKAAIEELEPPE
jgi:pyruvate/2-oxoglutarate dehydrogenase complex dihydrolipoamide acyltransferase (E2) component